MNILQYIHKHAAPRKGKWGTLKTAPRCSAKFKKKKASNRTEARYMIPFILKWRGK